MKKVITYGTYDLLHQGHINLLRRAKELGDYLIVGVTNDSFDRDRGKLNVRNNVLERVEAVKATGYADQIIIEDYVGQKIDDIQKYDVDIFAIGSDWEGKLDYLNELVHSIRVLDYFKEVLVQRTIYCTQQGLGIRTLLQQCPASECVKELGHVGIDFLHVLCMGNILHIPNKGLEVLCCRIEYLLVVYSARLCHCVTLSSLSVFTILLLICH